MLFDTIHNCEEMVCCDFCENKLNPTCLDPNEKNLSEQGGGYACCACSAELEEEEEGYIIAENIFTVINIGDNVYDQQEKLLGKCFYKSIDNSETVCLENGRIAIWIKGLCLKQGKSCMFIGGDITAFYKDTC